MGKLSKAETLADNEAVASAKYVRMGPRKVRRVVDVIRGMKTDEALTVLQFSPWRACDPVSKVLRSAVANAENNKQLDGELLWISEAYVDEGPSLRRWRPRAQGRAYPVHKRTSHITVVVEERGDDDADETGGRRASRSDRRAKKSAAKDDKPKDDKSKAKDDEAKDDKAKARGKHAKADDDADDAVEVDEVDEVDEAEEAEETGAAKKATAAKPAKKAATEKASADNDADEADDAGKASDAATEGESS